MKKARFLIAAVALLALSAAMAADFQVPNRIAVAKVGEWASYTMPNGYVQKQTVISRTGGGPEASVVVKIENIYEGRVITTTEVVEQAGEPLRDITRPDDPNVKVDVKTMTMTIKGKGIPVSVIEVAFAYEDEDEDDEDVKWYLSSAVPVFGIVRQETDGDVEYELLDFGTE